MSEPIPVMSCCTTHLSFSAGHRILGHKGKCASWHGHNYEVYITCIRKGGLDPLGIVVDFSLVKDLIGGYIKELWDHGFLIYVEDKALCLAAAGLSKEHKTCLLPFNPTAENLAKHLLEVVCPGFLEEHGIVTTQVRIGETPNCFGEAMAFREDS